jgi:hypothetical protein
MKLMLATLRGTALDCWRTAMIEGAKSGKHAAAERLLEAVGDITVDARKSGPNVVIVVGDGKQVIGNLPQLPAEFRDAIEAETVQLT